MDKVYENRIREIAKTQWLGLGNLDSLQIDHPMRHLGMEGRHDPALFYLRILRKPENFSFTCKHILNVNLIPEQLLIIQCLWKYAFPMFIASRGFGKCVNGNSLIVSCSGIKRIDNIVSNRNVFEREYFDNLFVKGENGFLPVEYGWFNGRTETKKIGTKYGFELESTLNHPIRVVRDGEIKWVDTDKLIVGDRIPICRDEHWFENTNSLTKDEAYLFGLLTGDGGYTVRGHISFTNTDDVLISEVSRISQKLWGKSFKQQKSDPITYNLYGVSIWDELFDKYGFNSSECAKKSFPKSVLSAKKDVVATYIRGLMDTDGGVENDGATVSITLKSKECIRVLQFVLTQFGIISSVNKKYVKRVDTTYYRLSICGLDNLKIFRDQIGFGLSHKMKELSDYVDSSRKSNPNDDTLPHELIQERLLDLIEEYKSKNVIGGHGYNYTRNLLAPSRIKAYELSYQTLNKILTLTKELSYTENWKFLDDIVSKNYFYDEIVSIENSESETFDVYIPDDHSFISNGFISHNTFLLAVYSILIALLRPGSKIIIAGAGFRQSKNVLEVVENIWSNAPILRDLCGAQYSKGRQGLLKEPDKWLFRLGKSTIIGIPIGVDGSKIRGFRATNLVIDEFSSLSPDIYETVLVGFAAVTQSPIENVKRMAEFKYLEKMGIPIPDKDKLVRSNQIVLAGTAYWSFNHFYRYWKMYHDIIASNGDKEVLKSILGEETDIDNIKHTDYCILRIPYDIVPEGFMDIKQIARSQATMTKVHFGMEYQTCVTPNTLIMTNYGAKRIKSITKGDLVLTHNGKFKMVKEVYSRYYCGRLNKIKVYGYNKNINITPEHPFYIGNEKWLQASDIEDFTCIPHLNDISNISSLDVFDYVDNISTQRINKIDYVYPTPSMAYRETKSKWSIVTTQKRKSIKLYKGSVPKILKLDYDFGIILGYYASEGSVGASGRSVRFSLDGHIEDSLVEYIKQLKSSIKNVLGLFAKEYRAGYNCVNVTVNSRLFACLIKKMCPGVARTKYILPEILFSNKEFMLGFLTGYWNGDGHWRKNKDRQSSAHSASLRLITQVKMVLSYFKIPSSLREIKPGKGLIRGKEIISNRHYELSIYGDNNRLFKKLVYNYLDGMINNNLGDKKIISDEILSRHTVYKNNVSNYSGYVYNLEVEDDNSYCTMGGIIHNCWGSDTQGYFSRRLIESCVTNKPIPKAMGDVKFDAALSGDPGGRYVIGVDPASEADNFAIVVLELHKDHRRVVYTWTTRRTEFKKQKAKQEALAADFYGHCARKIRELMRVFPTTYIAMDAQASVGVQEALESNFGPEELPILPFRDFDNPRITDNMSGLHIVKLIQFAQKDWVQFANEGLKHDLEQKNLLFPAFDHAGIVLAMEYDNQNRERNTRYAESLESCIEEIEELKDELATIVVTELPSGRLRWDTPEIKTADGKKGRLRKDRYSALLLANGVARQLMYDEGRSELNNFYGGIINYSESQTIKKVPTGGFYTGPDDFKEASQAIININNAMTRRR